MAQTPKKQDIEPWLKPLKNRPLSHGSNPYLTCRFSHGGQWTSHEIQNEIISLLAKFTESKIMQQVNNKTFDQQYIGIISDETSDISHHDQISLVLSYIDSEGTKRETFLCFIETASTDGETWFNLIVNKLSELGIDLEKIIGLGFDGASNMSGGTKGVAAQFKDVSPMSTYIHCYSHLL